jgi:hypothetical protein
VIELRAIDCNPAALVNRTASSTVSDPLLNETAAVYR